MNSRRLQRLAALAVFVNSIAVAGLVANDRPSAAAVADRFAGMPTPEALVVPTPSGEAAVADAADSPTLYHATARLRAGTHALHRFDSSGRVIARRTLSLGYARVWYALASQRTFSGSRYVKLTSGEHAGWWVRAGSTIPSMRVALSPTYTLTIARGTVTGRRFLGPVTLRRSMLLPSAATYHASASGRFEGRLHYLLSDGPLAGRWVSASRVTTAVNSAVSTRSPAPTATPAAATPAPTVAAATAVPSTAPTATAALAPAATWRAIALVYRETDVTFRRADGTNYRLQARMGDAMHGLVRDTLSRTVRSVTNWSGGYAAMNLTIVDVPHALTAVEPLGSAYWVGPQSVQQDMDRYAPSGTYDSIFVVFHPRDAAGVEIPIGGWGLTIPGGSWSNGAGFTSVITPGAMWWWTDSAAPEEVFIHEWLHQVIFFHQDAGRLKLDLHDGRSYGYDDRGGTWKLWYSDIMQGKVPVGTGTTGLTREIWAAGKPTGR